MCNSTKFFAIQAFFYHSSVFFTTHAIAAKKAVDKRYNMPYNIIKLKL